MTFQAVIFDMDGVLIDSERLYNVSDAELFAELGLPFGTREIEAITGASYREFGRQVKSWHPDIALSEEELCTRYADSLLNALKRGEVQLEPGVEDWMRRLKQAGVQMTIASSSIAPMVHYIIERFALDNYLTGAVTGSDVLRGKPSPDIFLKAAELLGVEPQRCLVIEDSENGIKAALAAGMHCYAYTATNRHGLDQSQAHQRFDAFDEAAWQALMAPCLA